MNQNKIVFVEDHDDLAYLGALYLKYGGYSVSVAKSGKEGLSLARSSLPQLIVLDLTLPDMGLEEILLAYGQFATSNQIPIVLLSGLTDLEKWANCLSTKFYLRKPYSREDLLKVVREAVWKENSSEG